jgi:hypothetical protein
MRDKDGVFIADAPAVQAYKFFAVLANVTRTGHNWAPGLTDREMLSRPRNVYRFNLRDGKTYLLAQQRRRTAPVLGRSAGRVSLVLRLCDRCHVVDRIKRFRVPYRARSLQDGDSLPTRFAQRHSLLR